MSRKKHTDAIAKLLEDRQFRQRVTPTRAEIEAKMTKNGGYTKASLAEWGIPWPPPKGWKKILIEENEKGGE